MSQFNAGDKVQLNIGGPVMVVLGQGRKRIAWNLCTWFAGKKSMEAEYPDAALVKAVEAVNPAPDSSAATTDDDENEEP